MRTKSPIRWTYQNQITLIMKLIGATFSAFPDISIEMCARNVLCEMKRSHVRFDDHLADPITIRRWIVEYDATTI